MALTVAGLVSDVGSMMLRWELVMLTVLQRVHAFANVHAVFDLLHLPQLLLQLEHLFCSSGVSPARASRDRLGKRSPTSNFLIPASTQGNGKDDTI